MDEGPVTFYVGVDPTGPSLHIGHMVRFRDASSGNCGAQSDRSCRGGTGMIGDPSGKTEMRKILTLEQIQDNCVHIKEQLGLSWISLRTRLQG
jgi:tyrosyl-tRNA synthetase